MYPVSDTFLGALRGSHTVATRVDAFYGTQCVASDLPVSDGSVSVSAGTGVHRKLDVTIADPSLWETLSPIGTELRAYRGIRYPGGATEMVPLGIFSIDQQSTPVLARGTIAISSAPDRWAAVQRARFELPRVSDTGFSNVEEIVRLISEVVPARVETGGVTLRNSLSTTTIGTPVVWDRDRDKAVQDLATAAGVEVFFGPEGELIIRDVAVMDNHPVWEVDAGRDGVMISGTATRDRTRVYNVVVVLSTKTDGSAPFAPQVVADTDPTSPTNANGPYGRVPYFVSTALIANDIEAQLVGRSKLAQVRGRYIDMSVSALVNPALESGDTIAVPGVDGHSRLYLVDSLSIPLTTEGSQDLTLRSQAAVSSDSETQGSDTSTSSSSSSSSSSS